MYFINHIKDEDRFYGSLNKGALIYINSHSKAIYNKLGLAYGQGNASNLWANWSQDFYIYHNGYFDEQAPTLKLGGLHVKDDWKLPKPSGERIGGGLGKIWKISSIS